MATAPPLAYNLAIPAAPSALRIGPSAGDLYFTSAIIGRKLLVAIARHRLLREEGWRSTSYRPIATASRAEAASLERNSSPALCILLKPG